MSVVPLNRRAWPDKIKSQTYAMLQGKNVRFLVADRAYKRWRADGVAEPCKYAPDAPPDCSCAGCIEKLLFFLFDQVSTTFAPMPGDAPRPLGTPL